MSIERVAIVKLILYAKKGLIATLLCLGLLVKALSPRQGSPY